MLHQLGNSEAFRVLSKMGFGIRGEMIAKADEMGDGPGAEGGSPPVVALPSCDVLEE